MMLGAASVTECGCSTGVGAPNGYVHFDRGQMEGPEKC